MVLIFKIKSFIMIFGDIKFQYEKFFHVKNYWFDEKIFLLMQKIITFSLDFLMKIM